MERSVKYLLKGLNQFHGANLTLIPDVDQGHIDVWIALKTPNISMHHRRYSLVCTFVVRLKYNQIFFQRGPIIILMGESSKFPKQS